MSILDRIDTAFDADLACNTDKVILLAISRHADANGACWLSWSTLQEYTTRSRGTVWRSLRRLEDAGEIAKRTWFVESQYGRQSANCYILTSIADTAEKVEAAFAGLGERRIATESRQRDGEGRANATGRVAPTRPLEVIPVSGSSNPNGEIGMSGYAASLSDSGEVEPQQQQPTDDAPDAPTSATITTATTDTTTTDPADPPAQHDAVTYAWIDVFGELSDPRTVKFLSNRVRSFGADEVLRTLALAKGQLEKGKEIAKPAAYVKRILTNRMNEIGSGHRTAKQTPAAGHRNPTNWSAVAEDVAPPIDLAALDAATERAEQERQAKRQEMQAEQARRDAEAAERRRQELEQARIDADQKQIEREHRNQAAAADKADKRRREVAAIIAGVIGNEDTALREADAFLRDVGERLQQIRLGRLTQEHNRAKQPLPLQQVTAILHGGLTAVPARVAA